MKKVKDWIHKNSVKILYWILALGLCACVSRATFLITKEYSDNSHTEIIFNPIK